MIFVGINQWNVSNLDSYLHYTEPMFNGSSRRPGSQQATAEYTPGGLWTIQSSACVRGCLTAGNSKYYTESGIGISFH